MTRSAATESVPLRASAECIALCASTLLLAISLWLGVQRARYLPLLAIALPAATPEERLALPWTVCAQTVLFLAPGVLVATLAYWRRRPRLGRRLFSIYSTALLALIALDLEIYVALGRHLAELAHFALLPGAAQVAGDNRHWYWLLAFSLALGALATSSATRAARRGVNALSSRLSVELQRALATLFLLVFGVGTVVPVFFGVLYRHPAVREGLSAQLIWAPRLSASLTRSSFRDPHWAALENGLRESYGRVFPLVFAQHHITVEASTPGKRPNVLLIVVESFRADAFTEEHMPRVFAWAKQGLVAKQHFGGSNYSEAGAFSLLFGRSPLLFDYTLDTHQPPTWCEIAHQLDMDCSYYSGHPRIWMRREEFLNPRVVDHFVHDDTGGWNQWDRTALAHAVAAIKRGGRPAIATVLLMSTHFEYQYPPEYERHLPVLVGAKWSGTNLLTLGPSNRIPLTNRYLNSVAFTDDLVADTIDSLAGTNTIIVFTGDHGESLGDDGRFGHGYSFADVLTHVPFAMVGPGIPASTREAPSLHSDVLRTLIPLLGGKAGGPAESQDLLALALPRSSLLFAHCSYSHDFADALLVRGKLRIRLQLGLRTPELKLMGARDVLGHPASLDDVSPAQIAELQAAFEHELRVLWQPEPR